MRVLVAVAILALIPTASAGELTWHAPDEVRADHPVFAAYAIEGEESAYEGHVNIDVRVELDGHLLFSTASVHEHDGVHTLTVTPPAAGTLQFVAVRDGEVAGRHDVTVLPTAHNETGFPEARVGWGPDSLSAAAGVEAARLLEQRDSMGRLMLSGWVFGDQEIEYRNSGTADASPRAWFASLPGAPESRGAIRVEADAMALPMVQPSLNSLPDLPACGPHLVTDPNTLAPEGRVWQAGSDIRVTMLTGDGPTTYTFFRGPVDPGSLPSPPPVDFRATVDDPFGQLTFNPGGPGPGWLLVERGDTRCQVEMAIVPAPADGSGAVEAALEPRPVGQRIEFTPYGADGATLGHYEFDTRVLRVADDHGPGRLVWMGKLHGHGGMVGFDLHNLEPGTYEVVTYPSPQNLDVPTVATDDPDGFLYTFEVAPHADETAAAQAAPWTREDESSIDEAGAEQEAPFGLLLLPLLVALFLRRR